jgi:methyl-accepting chemotaxis protein
MAAGLPNGAYGNSGKLPSLLRAVFLYSLQRDNLGNAGREDSVYIHLKQTNRRAEMGAHILKISSLLKGIGITFSILSVLLLVSIFAVRSNYSNMRSAVERQAEFKQLGIDLANASDYLTNEARQYVQFGDKKYYDNYWREVNETKTRDHIVERLKAMNAPQNELDLIQEAKDKSDALVKTEDAAMKAVQQGDFTTARQLMFDDKYEANKQIIMAPIKKFQDTMNARAANETNAAETRLYFFLYAALVMVILVALSMISSVVLLFKKIQPLNAVVRKLEELAGNKGDLTARLPDSGGDEIGQLARSFNVMLDNYRAFVRHIVESAQQLSAATQQISASTEEIAGGSQTQANVAQKMNEMFKDFTQAMESVSVNSEEAARLSEQTSRLASEGGDVITKSVDGMERLSEQVSALVHHSEKVGQIIEVIDDIADQTNLLALNAAIEAARAGEQGRGFAVVADEVRKLAERSSVATKEITQIIKTMQENMIHSSSVATETAGISRQSRESFQSILQMVKEVAFKVTEIAAATEQQTAQTSNMFSSMESIAAGSEESAAAAQQTASSTQILSDLAEQLMRSVSAFKLS